MKRNRVRRDGIECRMVENSGDVILSGLDPVEIDELRDWACYTKPIGPSIRITAVPANGGPGFSVVASGNEPGCESL